MCRPDYKKLGVLKQQFPDVPILALTATATRRVCQDLMEILRISACETFHTSVDRPNLYYSVRWAACRALVTNTPYQSYHDPKSQAGQGQNLVETSASAHMRPSTPLWIAKIQFCQVRNLRWAAQNAHDVCDPLTGQLFSRGMKS